MCETLLLKVWNVIPYYIDFGLAEKYRDSKGTHRPYEKSGEFVAVLPFASRSAMVKRTQSRRDDIESLYYLLTYLSGITPPQGNDMKKLFSDKDQFCKNFDHIVRFSSF